MCGAMYPREDETKTARAKPAKKATKKPAKKPRKK
jgi:hypothetical protein